jgi:hypothetical protein
MTACKHNRVIPFNQFGPRPWCCKTCQRELEVHVCHCCGYRRLWCMSCLVEFADTATENVVDYKNRTVG